MAKLGSAARPHFAPRQIQDAGFVSARGHFYERTASGEFDIVGMRGDSQQIEIHGASEVSFNV